MIHFINLALADVTDYDALVPRMIKMPGHFPPTQEHEEKRSGGGVGRPGWASKELCSSVELTDGSVSLLDQELPHSGPSLASSEFFLTHFFSGAGTSEMLTKRWLSKWLKE